LLGSVDDGFQSGLEDRDFAVVETLYLVRVNVDTYDLITHIGQTSARHQSHVTSAKNRHSHADPRYGFSH
jgi:hypothetical protein